MSPTVGERRMVSVLVAEVAGSTSIAEKLGPERRSSSSMTSCG
jgi:class 3 adenylate cyclase